LSTATIPDAADRRSGPFAARAKVNLYLHVTGRRDDGYHLLDSLFVRVDLADRLWLVPSSGDGLVVSGPFASALGGDDPAANLVMRALDAVRLASDRNDRFEVHLEKNIPVAAGLGGGSADAAAMLKAAAAVFGFDGDLAPLALKLGADVPPCLIETPVTASGIGEILCPAPPLPSAALVLVNPSVPVATPEVFARRSGDFTKPHPLAGAPTDPAALAHALACRSNDLERAAVALAPEIGDVLDRLAAAPGVLLARMSGSGATCFGLTATLDDARLAAEHVARDRPAWWTAASGIVGGQA